MIDLTEVLAHTDIPASEGAGRVARDFTRRCWCSLAVAREREAAAFVPGTVSLHFVREVTRPSLSSDGPSRARDFLAGHGVRLVVVSHLSRTHLDGATPQLADGSPVVSLTPRHDRLDNFWFCLAHELAHVGRHLGAGATQPFIDDFSASPLPGEEPSKEEKEADEWARDALIPSAVWEGSLTCSKSTATNVMALASDLGIAPAIVAGRVRFERRAYRLLSYFVRAGEVRRQLA